MSDEPILLFRKVLGGLRPANAAADRAMAALDGEAIRVRITRTNGNTRRNSLYWACLHVAAPMLSERVQGGPFTPELLHNVLKDRAGLVHVIKLPSGDIVKDYDSTSFAKMTEPKRAEFIDFALETLSTWLGCSVADLRREGEAEAA